MLSIPSGNSKNGTMKKLINKNDDFNQDSFSFDEWPGMEQKSETKEIEPEQIAEETAEEKKTRRRSTECIVRTDRNIYRKAYSESKLLDAVGIDFKDGESYHCITAGDVDSLSYLKAVLRQQDLEYCLFSTWCMAADDILQIEEWLESGKIKQIDAYIGEIFPNSYRFEYAKLRDLMIKYRGRLVCFRNHSKIYAGYGKKFAFGIETSANINTNPRTENGCITIGRDIFDFYRQYFDGIISIVKLDEEEINKPIKAERESCKN